MANGFMVFHKAVRMLHGMAVTVTYHALSTVRTNCVTYNLDTVLHVILDGQEALVLQVCQFNNLRLI